MSLQLFQSPKPIDSHFKSDADIVLFNGNVQDLLAEIPDKTIQLIITSPPYNLEKITKAAWKSKNIWNSRL
jgi:adenine-specific DNA-methyltransferase